MLRVLKYGRRLIKTSHQSNSKWSTKQRPLISNRPSGCVLYFLIIIWTIFFVASSLFGWLVNRVNSIINKGERFLSINILDIFGFEDFPVRWWTPSVTCLFLSIFFCCRLHFFNDRFDCLVALPCQRGVAGEQLRTNVHQLRQREPTILLQQAHFQAGTAGIRQGEDPVAEHQLHGQSARHQLDRQEAHRCPAPARRRVQLPQSHRRFLLGKMPLQPRPQRALLQA